MIAFVLAVVTIVSVFQNHELTGAEKAVWVAAVILFPILGALVYFGVRPTVTTGARGPILVRAHGERHARLGLNSQTASSSGSRRPIGRKR